MTFKYTGVCKLPEVELEKVDGKHYYLCDNYAYPSVTTILGETADKYNLNKWRLDVGEEVANHIASTSAAIGTEAHRFNEAYLNNRMPDWAPNENTLFGMAHHENMQPYLDRISTILGTEIRILSEKHGFAGTSDCIGEYEGKLSVIDFKCKKKPQKDEWMHDYFLQAAAYGLAWEEMTGVKPVQGVILVSHRYGKTQEFIVKFENHASEFLDRLAQYKNNGRPVRKGIKVP